MPGCWVRWAGLLAGPTSQATLRCLYHLLPRNMVTRCGKGRFALVRPHLQRPGQAALRTPCPPTSSEPLLVPFPLAGMPSPKLCLLKCFLQAQLKGHLLPGLPALPPLLLAALSRSLNREFECQDPVWLTHTFLGRAWYTASVQPLLTEWKSKCMDKRTSDGISELMCE